MKKAIVAANIKSTLGESPFWNEEEQKLYWVDILGGKLHMLDPATAQEMTVDFQKPVANAVVCGKGWILALVDGLYYWGSDTGVMKPLGAPEGYRPEVRFNDGKCDAAGRLYIGTCSDIPGDAALYRWTPEKQWETVIKGVSTSNGIAWSNNNTKMYYIDTPTREIWSFDYDLTTGAMTNKQVAIQFLQTPGNPDGMCIDSDGMLWIAHWGGFCVGRWDPVSGKCLQTIPVPSRNVSACAFGGKEQSTLYITTALAYAPDEDHLEYPLSGYLFSVEPGVKGRTFYSCQASF